jgi:hypothetical protein
VIRTAFMSTHKKSQIDFVLEVMDRLARKHRIRACDLEQSEPLVEESDFSTQVADVPDPVMSLSRE